VIENQPLSRHAGSIAEVKADVEAVEHGLTRAQKTGTTLSRGTGWDQENGRRAAITPWPSFYPVPWLSDAPAG
jgi:hypothetical protein